MNLTLPMLPSTKPFMSLHEAHKAHEYLYMYTFFEVHVLCKLINLREAGLKLRVSGCNYPSQSFAKVYMRTFATCEWFGEIS